MKLIDTNIIIYSKGKAHPYKKSCSLLLNNIALDLKSEKYNTDIEVFYEIAHYYLSKDRRDKALKILRDLRVLFPSPFSISEKEVKIAAYLIEKYGFISIRDAIHTAIVINYKLEGIISADKHFDRLKEIKRFDPRKM